MGSLACRKRAVDTDTGRRLAELRHRLRGWSQKQFADAIGVSELTIRNYERGRTGIRADRLLQIAEALRCRAADILARPGSPVLKPSTWEID